MSLARPGTASYCPFWRPPGSGEKVGRAWRCGAIIPPVGLNLFFASYRFDRPLLHVYRAAVPFLLILAFGVVLITYLPWLSLGLLELLGRSVEALP